MIKKITHWLIFLTLFTLPLQTRWIIKEGIINNGPWEYGTISLYATSLLIILSLIFFIISQKNLNLHFEFKKYHYVLLGFVLYCLVMIPFSLSPLLSLYKLGIIFLGISLFYILSKIDISFRHLSLAFVSGATLNGLLGIWQFLSQSTFASKWLGLAEHDARTLGVSVIEAVAPDGATERWLRAYGSLDHPNMFGGLMALALIIASWLWLFRNDAKNKIEGLILIFSIAILSAETVLSFSRAAWLAATTGIVILIISYLYKTKKIRPDFIGWLATITIVISLISFQYSYLFSPRLSGDTRLEQISTHERLDGLGSAKDLLLKKPFFGFGLGTYTLALEKNNPKKLSWFYQPVHNTFLLLAAELGIFGLILVLSFFGTFFIHIYKDDSKDENNPISEHRNLVLALILAVIIIALFDHWLFSLPFGIMLSGSILGIMAASRKPSLLTE
jgi:hypothetical protein